MTRADKLAAMAQSRGVFLSGLLPYRITQIRGRKPWRLMDSSGQSLLYSHYSTRCVLNAAAEGRVKVAPHAGSTVPEVTVWAWPLESVPGVAR